MPQIEVIGESCKDVFVYCEAVRLAPDLPVPVLEEIHTETNPGMAANVARNIQSRSIATELITNNNWESFIKTRYVHDKSNHMFFRVDTSNKTERINLSNLKLDSDIIVIADYNKGFLTESDIEYICSSHSLVFLDTKKILGSWAENAKYIKINDYEFNNSQNFLTDKLVSKIIHTRGADGSDFLGKNFPVERFEIRDTSGAGDSFMAALVAEFLISSDIEKSINAANAAASKVVRTRGVGII
jgi:bifunctional ADP-heptose synthase (sugar kinase/adenylyltransferase)